MAQRARPKPSKFVLIVYEDGEDQWRWRLKSRRNGRILADSGEAYTRRSYCRQMARAIFAGADVEIIS